MNTGMQELIKKFGEDNGTVATKFKELIDQIADKGSAAFGEEGTVTKAFNVLNDLLGGEDGVIANYKDLADKFANDASTYSTQASEVSTLAESYKILADNIQLSITRITEYRNLVNGDNGNNGTSTKDTTHDKSTLNEEQWHGDTNLNTSPVIGQSTINYSKFKDDNGHTIRVRPYAYNSETGQMEQAIAGYSVANFHGLPITQYKMVDGIEYYNVHTDNTAPYNWFTKGQIEYSFDTGGYTGDWHSSEGRLAMLHEKELVLKKEDTANFLDALEILRSLNLSMLNNLTSLNTIRTPSVVDSLSSITPLEQNVTIHAEFPDATDAQEIKEAFEELVNLATQRAFEK